MNSWRSGLVGLIVVVALAIEVQAANVFVYQGELFSNVTGPFTTADSVSGFVEFAAAPTPGGSFDETNVVDYSFTAGPISISPSSPSATASGKFTFDLSGAIETWLFTVEGEVAGTDSNFAELINTDWNGVDGDDVGSIDDGNTGFAFNEQVPGVWRLIPEPATLTLLSFAILCRLRYVRGEKV